jgi:hypothetical protein
MTDPETEDPPGGEAEAQDEGGLGVLAAAALVAWAIFSGGHHVREPAAAAPTAKSQSF